MVLADQLRKMDDIFAPLKQCKGKSVAITTWGVGSLGEPSMLLLMDKLRAASSVKILIGYSKSTHDLSYLLETALVFRYVLSWSVRFLPSFHTKAWIVGGSAYIGSCNFSPNTCVNRMWKVPVNRVKPHFDLYWNQAAQYSKSTDLRLIPQARIHA